MVGEESEQLSRALLVRRAFRLLFFRRQRLPLDGLRDQRDLSRQWLLALSAQRHRSRSGRLRPLNFRRATLRASTFGATGRREAGQVLRRQHLRKRVSFDLQCVVARQLARGRRLGRCSSRQVGPRHRSERPRRWLVLRVPEEFLLLVCGQRCECCARLFFGRSAACASRQLANQRHQLRLDRVWIPHRAAAHSTVARGRSSDRRPSCVAP